MGLSDRKRVIFSAICAVGLTVVTAAASGNRGSHGPAGSHAHSGGSTGPASEFWNTQRRLTVHSNAEAGPDSYQYWGKGQALTWADNGVSKPGVAVQAASGGRVQVESGKAARKLLGNSSGPDSPQYWSSGPHHVWSADFIKNYPNLPKTPKVHTEAGSSSSGKADRKLLGTKGGPDSYQFWGEPGLTHQVWRHGTNRPNWQEAAAKKSGASSRRLSGANDGPDSYQAWGEPGLTHQVWHQGTNRPNWREAAAASSSKSSRKLSSINGGGHGGSGRGGALGGAHSGGSSGPDSWQFWAGPSSGRVWQQVQQQSEVNRQLVGATRKTLAATEGGNSGPGSYFWGRGAPSWAGSSRSSGRVWQQGATRKTLGTTEGGKFGPGSYFWGRGAPSWAGSSSGRIWQRDN